MTTRERLHELVDELSEPEIDDALQALIQEAARRILRAAPPGTRLVLFGSAARGEANEHSDLDFLVIEPTVADPIRESVRLDRTLDGMLIPADIIVRSQESVRKWRDVYGTVINAALEEGLELAA
jgi:predicted nucleotidyltransferase